VAKYADLFRTGNKEIWDDGKMQNADTQESGDERFALLFVDDEVNVLNSSGASSWKRITRSMLQHRQKKPLPSWKVRLYILSFLTIG